MHTHTMKDLFRIMFQYARNEVKVRDADSAFWAAERATDAYIHNFGYGFADLEDILDVQTAVLWSIHWTLFGTKEKLPLWASERRKGFILSENFSNVWFEAPRLPA